MIHKARHDYVQPIFVYIGAIALLIVMTSFAVPRQYKEFGIIPARSKEASTPTVFNQSAFTSVSVRAKAYVVYDIVDEKIISEKNGELSLPLASITKVMTALTARIHAPPNAKITISQSSVDGGYDLGLKKNQVWKLDELLKYSLVFSSNDGAQAIADGLGGRDTFVKEMNNDAILLGLQLQFTQPAGLDIGGKLGGEGSAYEVAKLFAIARRRFPEVLDATTKTRVNVVSSTGPVKGIPNTNQDIENLLGAEASKTGFTDEAGGNLAVVVDVTVGRPVAIVVLGSTREERFSDMEILYKALQKSLIK